jgi:hypothetical protein
MGMFITITMFNTITRNNNNHKFNIYNYYYYVSDDKVSVLYVTPLRP